MLDDDARQKRATSPLRVFDVKNEQVRAALAGRAEDRRLALRRVRRALRAGARATSTRTASPYTLVPTLVRGLDYYTRTTFEFIGPDESDAELDDLRRRPLRRPRRGDRRPADAGRRLRRRHRAARARARARGRRGASRRRSTSSSPLDGGARATVARAAGRAARAAASPPTPTTPAARSRGSSRRPRSTARRDRRRRRADG